MGGEILVGAALGAAGSALTGGNPLKGGLLGGLTGGVGKYLQGALMNGLVTNAVAGGDPVKGLAINASLLGGSNVFGSGLPGVTQASLMNPGTLSGGIPGLEGTVAANAIPSIPSASALADQAVFGVPSGGLRVNPQLLNPFVETAPISETASAMGGGFQLPANAAQIMGQNPSLWASLKDYMPSGQSIAELGLKSATAPRQQQMVAPAGGITAGRAPDITAIEQLINKRKRAPASLIGDYFG